MSEIIDQQRTTLRVANTRKKCEKSNDTPDNDDHAKRE